MAYAYKQITNPVAAEETVDPKDVPLTTTEVAPSKFTVQYFTSLVRRLASSTWLAICWNVLLLSLAAWGLLSIMGVVSTRLKQPLRHSCYCGTSVEQARALGCKFDPLAFAWLPLRCRDEELTREFEQNGTGPGGRWLYWADRNRTDELSAEEISLMADDPLARFFTSWEWHVEHCFYYWRKQYRAQNSGVTVEPRYNTEEHINHCKELILAGGGGTVAGVVLNSDF